MSIKICKILINGQNLGYTFFVGQAMWTSLAILVSGLS